MKKILFLIIILSFYLLTSCVTSGFKDFYDPWNEESFYPEESYLSENETPEIIKTSDLNTKYREISSNWYWCLGYSGFNGPELDDSEIEQALINLCKQERAKIAIYSKEYTDTRNGVYSTPYTNHHTYTDVNGFSRSYSTTSYSTSSYSIQRYDFCSYLFVSVPEEYKIIYAPGFSVVDLLQEDRDYYKQNTGGLINFVYINTPAYYLNLVHGDIIIKINENPIYTANDFYEFKKKSTIDDIWNMTIIRNGQEKNVEISYKLK